MRHTYKIRPALALLGMLATQMPNCANADEFSNLRIDPTVSYAIDEIFRLKTPDYNDSQGVIVQYTPEVTFMTIRHDGMWSECAIYNSKAYVGYGDVHHNVNVQTLTDPTPFEVLRDALKNDASGNTLSKDALKKIRDLSRVTGGCNPSIG